MISFVYGLPGSGKTTLLKKRISDDTSHGKKTLLIVPEQQTVEVERHMLSILPPSAQLCFEVVNFSRLANKLFRIYGGLSYNYITKGMKQLFMKKTLISLSPMLSEYATRALGDSSLPSLMLSQIDEFKTNGINAQMLAKGAEELDKESSLCAKLSDLSLIYAAYSKSVSEAYDDSSDDLEKLHKILSENNFFGGYNVYIDSFSSYTEWEHKIIKRIFAQADNCMLTFPSSSPQCQKIHESSINDTSNKLRIAVGDKAEIIVLDEIYKTESQSLKRITRHLWDMDISSKELDDIQDDQAVCVIECDDMHNECEAAANILLGLIQSGKYRRGELAVIAGNMEEYKGTIDAALEKAEIPYFMSESSDLSAMPMASFVLCSLAIKQKNWRADDVIAYLKTGLLDIASEDIDLFEIYVSTWKIRGKKFLDDIWSMNPDGYSAQISPRAIRILEAANRVKDLFVPPLLEFFTKLDAAKSTAELCQAVLDFIKQQKIAEKMSALAKDAYAQGDRKTALECVGTHKAMINALSDIHAAFTDTEMSVEEFASSLKTVLVNTDISTIPTAADEVLLGSASTLRAEKIKCALIIGMCEGKLPSTVSDGGFFSDNEKKDLFDLGIEIASNTERNNAEQLLYAYRAMTLPSHKLFLLYNTSSDGGSAKPSMAIERVFSLLPNTKKAVYEVLPAIDRIRAKQLSWEMLSEIRDGSDRASLEEIFTHDDDYKELLKKQTINISDSEYFISRDTTEKLFGKEITLSQSKLERYVKCHFNYFGHYGLMLREEATAQLRSVDKGNLIHKLLEAFISKAVNKNGLEAGITRKDIEHIVKEEASKYFNNIFKNGEDMSPSAAHYAKRLVGLAVLVCESIYSELCGSSFLPVFVEAEIGRSQNAIMPPPTFTLDDGTSVSIVGKVDRIDVCKKNGDAYIKVVDYKTGSKTFSESDIENGIGVQLPLYLFAICNTSSQKLKKAIGCDENGEIRPAAIHYLSTAIPTVKTDYSADSESIESSVKSSFKRSGRVINDENILRALSHELIPCYLGDGKKAGEKVSDKILYSAENFSTLESLTSNVITRTASELKSGNAAIKPITFGGRSPCDYCSMKQFCRIDTNTILKNDEETEEGGDDIE